MSTIDLDTNNADMDEPPPTDPSPGVLRPLPQQVDNSDDELEKRLAWLAEEVRSTSAEHAKKKRAESVLEAREYKTALVPAATRTPTNIDLPKITLALGVDPQRDPTLVGRRLTENEWEFDISDPEELSRTLPLDPSAAVADPLPFYAPTNTKAPSRRRAFVVTLIALGGMLLGAFLQQSLTRYSAIPRADRGISQAAQNAELRYKDWEALQMLLAPNATSSVPEANSSEALPAPAPSDTPPAPASSIFKWVKPIPSAPKPGHSAVFPIKPSNKPRAPIYTDLTGF